MSVSSSLHIDAASIFRTALATARSTRTSADYQAAADWANKAAMEAPYGSKENYWAQAEELNAMANTLSGLSKSSPDRSTGRRKSRRR